MGNKKANTERVAALPGRYRVRPSRWEGKDVDRADGSATVSPNPNNPNFSTFRRFHQHRGQMLGFPNRSAVMAFFIFHLYFFNTNCTFGIGKHT